MVAMFSFAFTSCSTDNTDKPVHVPFSIEYSTGDAQWSEIDPEAFVLNKLGVGTTGTIPYLIVTSSAYWTVTVPEQFQEWLSVSPLGGPQPDETITNVYLTLSENSGETRDAYVLFNFASGEKARVPICQVGPVTDPTEGLLTFVNESFGANTLKENTQVKFYNGYVHTGIATAGDPDGFAYSYTGSDNTYITLAHPAQAKEYTCLDPETKQEISVVASAGENVVIDGKGYFTIRNFNNQGKTDFRVSFLAKNCDGKYRPNDLKLWVSKDNANWDIDGSLNYFHTASPVNDWTLNTYNFSIAPNVSNIIYFKFENLSDDIYCIDDILFTELEGPSDNVFSLIQTGSDIIGLPVNWRYNNLSQSKVNGQNWEAFGIILSEESGVYESDAEITINDAQYTAAHVQFIEGEASIVKERADGNGLLVTSSSPKVTGMYEGDFWLWTLPVHKVTANTRVGVNITFMGTDAGAKYMFFEWAQCSADDYQFAKSNLLAMDDATKRKFYETLDWNVWKPTSVEVPNSVDKSSSSSGIPIGNASSPAGYFKGTINYSEGFAGGPSSLQVTTDPEKVICTFPDAMDHGYFFFRLRCAHNLTCGPTNSTAYQRINKNDHNGTNYLRQTATFSFAGCGAPQQYDNRFRLLNIISNFGREDGYDGGDVLYSPKGQAGLFAGTTSNMLATTSGSNVFEGSCEINESGKRAYLYSPYDATASDVNDVPLSVPTDQVLADGALVADSAPFVMTNTPAFKTTSLMRCNVELQSAVVELDIHATKTMSEKISKIEVEAPTKIAGSYHYDLANLNRGTANLLTSSLTTKASTAITVSTDKYNPNKLYFGVWDGTHELSLRIYAGAYYYTVTIPAYEYEIGKVAKFELVLDTLPKHLDESREISGINNADKFLKFAQALYAGKTGTDLDEFRNIDGDLGFGGATTEEEKVIDMSGIDMSSWPHFTLPENFNGGGYRIKNLTINTGDTALFYTTAKNATISNLIFDESCSLNVDTSRGGDEWTWAMLVCKSTVGTNSVSMGNIENVDSYATVNIFGAHNSEVNHYVGVLVASASGAASETETPSHISNCRNFGPIMIHDLTQDDASTQPYYRYTTIGGLVGRAAGLSVTNCENHGTISMERVQRKLGTFYIAGICGYATNRQDANTSNVFGDVNNCTNYGQVLIGQESEVMTHTLGLGGLVGRTQWAYLTRLTNNANFKVKAKMFDPFDGYYSKDWSEQITGTTNSIDYFSVGGIFAFSQCNIATGEENTYLTNTGDINVECDAPGTMRAADNCGINVGGIMGLMGANAYNPHFNNCSNSGNITLKSNVASAEAYVGGVMGKMASNRYTATYVFTLNGSSNVGNVTFDTDEPETVVAHAGGVCGSMIYGEMVSDINAGNVVNKSTNPASTIGAILGTQHASSIGTACTLEIALLIEAASVGGSVNGVVLNDSNFADYIYGGTQSKDITTKDCSYFNF